MFCSSNTSLVLEEVVAFESLQALEQIAHLPSFSSASLNHITLTRRSSSYMATLGAFDLQCNHILEPSNNSVAYGGCSVLAFLDLYWCPLLGCVVSPQMGSILLYKELRHYVHGYHLLQGHNPESLVEHIKTVFNINPSTDLPALFERHRHTTVQYPIPGLHAAESRYHCPDCGQWYSSYKNHLNKGRTCRQSTSRHFSIPLYPPSSGVGVASLGTDYRIRLLLPDHRDFSLFVKINNRLLRRSEIAEELPLSTNFPEDDELVRSWLDPSFSNSIGCQAPKLQKCDTGFHFVDRGQRFCCLHDNTKPRSDCNLYTGCAVLSYFQLYFSPVLGAVVSPSRMTLLCHDTLMRTIRSRVHGADNQALWDHVVKSFSLLDDAEDMFASKHRSVLLNTPILGLKDPRLVFQCKHCGCSISFSRSLKDFNQHLSKYHPAVAQVVPIKTYAVRLWDLNAKCRYQAIMSDSWISSQESPINRSRIQVLSYNNTDAVHLKGSGFQNHFESWDAKPADLIRLINVHPDLQSWSAERTAWKIERCIEQIYRLAGDYLSDAERRLEKSPYLRRAVTSLHSKCVFHCYLLSVAKSDTGSAVLQNSTGLRRMRFPAIGLS
jgi:hypothetical protein